VAYNTSITRSDADVLVPEPVAAKIYQGAVESSVIMSNATRLPNMAAYTERLPVLNALPLAYFVGEAAPKQTSTVNWDHVTLQAAEIAVIQPIPEAVIDDANFDIWANVRPLIEQALGVAFDQAVISGVNAPISWPTDIVTAATAAGNVVTAGTYADLYDDVLSEGGVYSRVEADGYMVTGNVGAIPLMAKVRGTRSVDGVPLFTQQGAEGSTSYYIGGVKTSFPRNGAVSASDTLMISGDWSQLVYSMRQDITYKILTEATITDNSSPRQIIFSLGQDDMVAMRVVMRLAWQLPNPVNAVEPGTRYPFGLLLPTAGY